MSSYTDIHVPHETVNDDFVTIVEWHAEPSAQVDRGQVIVSIETSKTVLEVEAETDGYLQILKAAGLEVAVSEVIGRIHRDCIAAADLSAPKYDAAATPATAAKAGQADADAFSPQGATFSKKAKDLIQQHGINPDVFAGKGLVREAHVINYLESQKASPNPDTTTQQMAAPFTGHEDSDVPKRGLFHDAAMSANDRGQSILQLGLNYVFRNWLLGNLVRWAPRGMILPLHRLRGVKMGSSCFIDPTAIVETAYPDNITLGDDVRITAGAVIMTHIKAPHYLRDTGIMPAILKPVILEDHCFIGVNAVVMPGVTVGIAAVVASGAVVVNNVPPYTMVSGNPAKIVKRFRKP